MTRAQFTCTQFSIHAPCRTGGKENLLYSPNCRELVFPETSPPWQCSIVHEYAVRVACCSKPK